MNSARITPAIYIRWSTDDQGSGTTLDRQREACLKLAADRGLTVQPQHIFIDDGVSGAEMNRPALNRMRRLIEAGIISLVIVYKLDRLARRPYIAYNLVEEWRGKASIISVVESHIDTSTTVGQLGFDIALAFANHERNNTRDLTLAGKRRRAAEGRNPGIPPAYGYRIADKRFVVVEDEAAVVRRIFDEYIHNGKTDGQIARMLNDAGIRTRHGGQWHVSAIQRILRNPAYKGTLVYKDIETEGAFPIIIEPKLWEQAQAIRSRKAAQHPRRQASVSPYILSGRLYCFKCGRPMNGRVARHGRWENRYYACVGSIQRRECDCRAVRQERIEQAVISSLMPLLDPNELNRRIAAREGTMLRQLRQEIAGIEARLRQLQHELSRIRRDYRRGRIDADAFNGLSADIEVDRAGLSAALAQKKSELMAAEDESKHKHDLRQAVGLLQAWEGISLAQRKQVVQLLTQRIEWDDESNSVTVRTVI